MTLLADLSTDGGSLGKVCIEIGIGNDNFGYFHPSRLDSGVKLGY